MTSSGEEANRRIWAEKYRQLAIQANNIANYAENPDIADNDKALEQYSYLITEFGANLENILAMLYDVASMSYEISPHQFMMQGGFRALKINNHNGKNNG